MKILRNIKSFTLIEVMIAVIVIAVLASLALPRLSIVIERSRTAEALNILSVLYAAQQRYALEDPDGDNVQDTQSGEAGTNCLRAGMLDVDIANPTRNYAIYIFSVSLQDGVPNGVVSRTRRYQTPACPGTGTLYYYFDIDEEGDVICADVTGVWCSKFGY